MTGGLLLTILGLLIASVVGFFVYIEVVMPPWYQAQKDYAEKNNIRKEKLWQAKRKKHYLHKGN